MKSDIKKKFIDILFEPEEEEEIEEQTVEKKVSRKPVKGDDVSISARDILYRKSGSSAFIDLDETIKTAKENGEKTADYELTAQISPIFGLIKDSNKVVSPAKSVNEALINKPEDSHLEIITSPIYGYGSKSADVGDDVAQLYDSDAELHRLLDSDDRPYDPDHTYDDIDDDLNLFNYGEDEE